MVDTRTRWQRRTLAGYPEHVRRTDHRSIDSYLCPANPRALSLFGGGAACVPRLLGDGGEPPKQGPLLFALVGSVHAVAAVRALGDRDMFHAHASIRIWFVLLAP